MRVTKLTRLFRSAGASGLGYPQSTVRAAHRVRSEADKRADSARRIDTWDDARAYCCAPTIICAASIAIEGRVASWIALRT
jgi:hypothetical protein